MTSTFFANTNSKIRKLKEDKSYPVLENSGLSVIKRGKSRYFQGRMRFPFNASGKKIAIPIGVFEKDLLVNEAIEKWYSIKLWSKENNKNPKLFGKEEKEKVSDKTFKEVALEFLEDVFKPKNKQRTYKDRANKINQMLKFIGDETLISDLEIEKDGRKYISNMLKNLFHDSPVQLTRCRQLLNQIFNYAEDETFIRPNQNPVLKKFQWETGNKRKISVKTFAKTITKNSWGMLPEFLLSVNENACNASIITDLATKAHLLMCIRTGVISCLEWDWYNSENDEWIIPSQTSGLKRKKDDLLNDHVIPSTPEINKLMAKVREITGWQKYCFYSLGSKNVPHLGTETINDHFKNLGWKDKQSAHQWRSVITTSALEKSTFDYEVIDRQLGRMGHLNGTRGHYDRSTLLDKRRKFMEWWSRTLIEQGLKI
jgi:hypothetical protein